MIKAILFDLDDTLIWDKKSVKEAFKATCEIAAKKYAINPDNLEQKVRKNARALYASYETYSFTQMIGINPFEGLWGEFSNDGEPFRKLKEIAPDYQRESWKKGLEDLGVNDPEFGVELAKTFPVMRKKMAFVYEETYNVLDQLKGNYNLLLLTNGSPSLQQTKLEITPKLRGYFDHIVISGAFGRGKPDPAIFDYARGLLSVEKGEMLMVGDNLHTDVLGASRSGIASVWVNRDQKDHSEVAVPTFEIAHLEELLQILES
ncbi:HAD family hydrolase [Virgibacillus byunsanensis]|uniref:Phosphoserine phosphatase n=1 Tax=Virgibacillus byunsanensis TaxID=570945 RepID=A0ABW3LPW4_9BACI